MAPVNISRPQDLREALGSDATMDVLCKLIAGASPAVLVTDRLGRYVAANDAACKLTGYPMKELLQKALPDLTGVVDDPVADVLWRGFVDHGEQTGEFSIKRKDGSTILVRYDALTHVLPGLHATFLTPA